MRFGASFIPEGEVIHLHIDDHTAKKSGRHIQGRDRYRHGAGSARQEYRRLEGINLVLGIRRVPLTMWPEHYLSLPIGLARSLKPERARTLGVPYQSRSQLARRLVDLAAAQLPRRRLRVSGDGACATQAFLRHLPPLVDVVGRFLISAQLYQPAPKRPTGQRGAPRKKGDRVGSPTTLGKTPTGWQTHPTEAGAVVQSWDGIWQSVLPGRVIRMGVVRRPRRENLRGAKGKKAFGRHKPLAAFFSTDVA